MSECGLHWTEYFKAFGPTLIAIFVAYVAYQQRQVNRANLREKLFEKRFQVFEDTRDLISKVITYQEDKNLHSDFLNLANSSRFLFGKKMEPFLRECAEKQQKLKQNRNRADSGKVSEQTEKLLRVEIDEVHDWYVNELTNLADRFDKYLSFEKVKQKVSEIK